MDNTDVDNVKPTEECHEVHNVDESDRLVGQLFCHVIKLVTRTGCKARVVVTATNTNDQWVISKSDQKHNHALCTHAMTPFMRSNRAVSKADINEATTLKEVGVGTSQVMHYLTQQAGSYHNVGFTHKDLYNALQRGKAKKIVDGDVNALIAYFDYKKHDDPEFFMTYSVDKSGALYNLIWSDSTSRSNYTCFDDVIAFDTTYKDNLYGRPIMPIVGVNHHHNTIVFATVIITDETSQSFEWVLQNFLEAMMNKSPISVVTDGDRAMQRAIKSVIPYAKHRLCSWHLSRNAQANIEFNVQKYPWVIEKGNTRHLWAQAYLTGHFFANIRSTQRWTNDAKASAPSYVDLNVSPEVMQMARFAALRSTSSRLCYIASKTDESFKTARDEMKKLIEELENSFGLNDSVNQSIVVNNVRDPQRKQRKRKEVPKNKVEKKIR
ncbi:hypothetical protein F3Y22_tig00111837pilonHSYRG00747 [Hibiscus syriacus]|uniref:MULE transposase domain-containing protein n=1 Tax=Hibiscus syriacus TaxID=106335 RepID=A0A6A2Y7L2_HIBSY|nr:hypothetical protein F3Y22_tig00111837pilonHSYRG00747 [Hibiscus syriacus]